MPQWGDKTMRLQIKLLVAAILPLCSVCPAAGEPLYKISNGPGCREGFYAFMHPQGPMGSGMVVWIDVPQWRQLADEGFRQQVFEAVFRESLAYCKGRKEIAQAAEFRIPQFVQRVQF